MPNRLDLPPELDQLIEKRTNDERRQAAEQAQLEADRRCGEDRRVPESDVQESK